ncbi:hypothetical protein pb186bvf_011205 [Paramecium bursaria]
MLESNDFIINIFDSKPIIIKQFDTPLQIAHKFCVENKIPIRYLKRISQTIIGIIHSSNNPKLKDFKQYLKDPPEVPFKQSYTVEELINGFQNDENYYSFQQQKLDDISKRLYQNILSPSPEIPQITYSQTTKNVSLLQKQLKPMKTFNNQSAEKLNKSAIHRQSVTNFFQSSNKKVIPVKKTPQKSQNTLNRSLSNGKRSKTETNDDKFYKQTLKLFQLMDSDKDGLISPQRIELTKVSDEALNYLIQVLLEIDQNKMQLNSQQFYQLFEQHYQNLDSVAKQRFLTINT